MGKLIIMNCTIRLLSSTEKGNEQLSKYEAVRNESNYSVIKEIK